ncbi:chaperone NapD [Hydrogenimonas thermophila]|uniref:Chaperone NapD n=1 Tax=Hydrogenimonas thermophila TaxID=223786 RepID=A0A1I5L5E7_9BACT|nr:chaperone NapD [Hydrogenimonas thermophila]WOE70056.1 chaperone NapD [Hydrogenimonas thermophila]WOE72573.1 chaperone NapD [Hydrogenimonas thermophila]SFO92392.1 periplasmic nitrate reductase chaperone NapD [Hydrogenimonas thermophila]
MNISSIVVQVRSEYIDEVVNTLKESDFCDYHFHDKSIGKIIVTVEGENISEEIEKVKKIQAVPHVIAADMMMAYSEDELEAERSKLETGPNVPEMLNDDTIRAEDIVYNGDLKKKII